MSSARHYPQSFQSAPLSPRTIAYIVIGVAVLSALTVFFALCERDNSALLAAGVPLRRASIQPASPQRTPVVSADTQPAPDSVTTVTVPTATQEASPAIARSHTEVMSPDKTVIRRFVPFTLARSRHFQQIGPLSVAVWKIDPRHKLFDIAVIADGRRISRKHVGLDTSIWIPTREFSHPLALVANSVDRDGISGYLSEPQTSH